MPGRAGVCLLPLIPHSERPVRPFAEVILRERFHYLIHFLRTNSELEMITSSFSLTNSHVSNVKYGSSAFLPFSLSQNVGFFFFIPSHPHMCRSGTSGLVYVYTHVGEQCNVGTCTNTRCSYPRIIFKAFLMRF